MTRYEAFIEKSWRTSGLTQILVARIRDDGRVDIGFFLVDFWCLGVKDAFLIDDGGEADFVELLTERLPENYRERLHPACAKKMIDGAIAYAETLGFAPHRDYRKARRALSGLDGAACPETFTFGHNGRPCYVEGPEEAPERTDRILAILEARCGPDGFDFELFSEEEEAFDEARDRLSAFFASLEDEGPGFYGFMGLLTALQVCSNPVSPGKVLALFPDGGKPWNDQEQAQAFAADFQVYWNYLAALTTASVAQPYADDGPDPIDIFAEDFEEVEEPDRTACFVSAYISWAEGFIRATEQWPAAWGDALTRPDLVPYWKVVRAWADPKKPGHEAFLAGVEVPHQSYRTRAPLPQAILALARALRPVVPPPGAGA